MGNRILDGRHLQKDQTLVRSLVVLHKTTSCLGISLMTDPVNAPLGQQKSARSRRTQSTPGTTCTQRRASLAGTWLAVLPSASMTTSASAGLRHQTREEVHPQRGQCQDRRLVGHQVLYQKNLRASFQQVGCYPLLTTLPTTPENFMRGRLFKWPKATSSTFISQISAWITGNTLKSLTEMVLGWDILEKITT